MKIISVREHANFASNAIQYFQKQWADENTNLLYEDCILHSLKTKSPLPQWYLLMDGDEMIGCAGLITNDFISRMDLYPWLCALFIDESYRGHSYSQLLIDYAKHDAKSLGFSNIYLCSDLVNFYEKYGFTYMGIAYQPFGNSISIYQCSLLD